MSIAATAAASDSFAQRYRENQRGQQCFNMLVPLPLKASFGDQKLLPRIQVGMSMDEATHLLREAGFSAHRKSAALVFFRRSTAEGLQQVRVSQTWLGDVDRIEAAEFGSPQECQERFESSL